MDSEGMTAVTQSEGEHDRIAPQDDRTPRTTMTAKDTAGRRGMRWPVKGQATAGWVILFGGLLGLFGSFSLLYEKFAKLSDPNHTISCDINPWISCGSVMETPQAALFGFPNPFIGMAAFPMVVLMGVLLAARVRLPRFVVLLFNLGTLGGLVFIGWLIYQTTFNIGILCPYCMVVWAGVIPVFWFSTVHSLRSGAIPIGEGWRGAVDDLLKAHWIGLVILYLIPAVLVFATFSDKF